MQSLKPYIGTSSSFYSCLGFCYLRERRIKDAKAVFQEAQDFTSVPDVYRGLYYSYRMQGNNEKAKQYKFYLDVMNIKIAEK
jgi:pentatricopeptide repeat protein